MNSLLRSITLFAYHSGAAFFQGELIHLLDNVGRWLYK
jgi:hypothetical protein